MKALTIQQPWAWAIAAGHKRVENRSWATHYRGPLGIHAGKTWDHDAVRLVKQLLVDLGVLTDPRQQVPDRHLLATGAVLGVAELTGVCGELPCRCGPWAGIGLKHWQLPDMQPFDEPLPARGAQGLWDIDLPGYELADRDRARTRFRGPDA